MFHHRYRHMNKRVSIRVADDQIGLLVVVEIAGNTQLGEKLSSIPVPAFA